MSIKISEEQMRTSEEINRALNHLRDAYLGGVLAGDADVCLKLNILVKCLEWVNGSEEAGGFGDLLRDLERTEHKTATKIRQTQ